MPTENKLSESLPPSTRGIDVEEIKTIVIGDIDIPLPESDSYHENSMAYSGREPNQPP